MEFSRNMDKEDIEYVKFIMEYSDGYSPLLLQNLGMSFSDSKHKKKDYVACVELVNKK